MGFALRAVELYCCVSGKSEKGFAGLTIGIFGEEILRRAIRVGGTSAMAEGQIVAFRAIFPFHKAQRTFQELLTHGAVHDDGHVRAREDVSEYKVRKAAHEEFALTHIPSGADANEGVRAVLDRKSVV